MDRQAFLYKRDRNRGNIVQGYPGTGDDELTRGKVSESINRTNKWYEKIEQGSC